MIYNIFDARELFKERAEKYSQEELDQFLGRVLKTVETELCQGKEYAQINHAGVKESLVKRAIQILSFRGFLISKDSFTSFDISGWS